MTTKLVNKHKNDSYDMSIGRGSKWGNDFTHLPVENTSATYQVETLEQALKEYSYSLLMNPELLDQIPELIGKVLGCTCLPNLCHGEVLVNLANAFEKYKADPVKFRTNFQDVTEIYRMASSQRNRAFLSRQQLGLLSSYWIELTSKEKQELTEIDMVLARNIEEFCKSN
ncbi:DUF4326 domain-containing protein [Paenibacillus pabuli]|uniref:DUF4326 domain-containing protein n=1 Tax=Paenibacillus pabuli TaxID=1472 RepID=UPI003242CF37